ncbi:hypothetical protein [Plantactinospora sp. GCM10030261]|uniref:hypothetical protein n=1 Tax=Plantactinospora sp. GCM10030261 TaxID=3273420 RepID=UPI00360FE221
MRHPTDGTLRRLLDEPAGVPHADREHIAGCPACLSDLAAAEQDAAVAGAALNVEVRADVDAGWHRLSREVAAQGNRPAAGAPAARRSAAATISARRWRAALRSPVIAAVGVAALLAGASTAAAADWLQIFRAERIVPVTAPEADLVKLPELSAFGEVTVTEAPRVRAVADATAAERAVGLSVPRVGELPRGVTGEPTYHVGNRVTGVFTFSADTAARTVAATGGTLPPPPPGLDGSQFRLSAGPGIAAVWSAGRPVPALVVGRAVAPTAYSSGVPFETARDYILSLPGLPENVASQLRGFTADGTTLPLFMPTEEMTNSPAEVGGVPATVVTARDGSMAGVVWVNDGAVTLVAGSLTASEVLSVARGLRWGR